ncbi:MAG: glycosyl transferase [Flavobacteriales bacterium]|nr:glycosyl transferase [Flavobacteriales bacterium]|tara:strand:+ start:17407 stop:17994 length:588 start_codon:yes stop_codon:yes gene_type:complete
MKRLFDILSSAIAFILLSPILIVLAVAIMIDSKGGIFYKQKRIGKNGKAFMLYKFRSMRTGSDRKGLITVGSNDDRTTKVGRFIRKYKLDELPQLINILKNEMSVVGPRPEVEKYVQLYTAEQQKVLNVKPGLTDLASLAYINENEILGQAKDPEKTYVEQIMPAKLRLNLEYIEKQSFWFDLQIIAKTLMRIVD